MRVLQSCIMLVHRATLSNAHTSNQRASDSDSSTANIAKPKRNLHMYKHKHINEEDQTNNALDKETQNARRGGEREDTERKLLKDPQRFFIIWSMVTSLRQVNRWITMPRILLPK